jgi:uncharacterized membrane protein
MKKMLPFFVAIATLAWGCDYVEIPTQTNSGGGGGGGNGVTRRVLIEDFTGHTCPNCPSAAVTLHNLQTLYPDQVMGIAIHAGWFSEPCPPHPLPNGAQSGSFSNDLRSAAGNDYDLVFGLSSSPPIGMVNHLGYPNNYALQQGAWVTKVDSLLQTPAVADLEFDTVIYNSSTRELNVTVNGKFITAQNGTFHVCIMLVEDGITNWQIDGSQYLPNYVFDHVLRDCINTPGSIAGTQIATGTIAANSTFNWALPAAYTISNSFNASNCKLVAYIYNTANKEVLQAVEIGL